MPVVAGDFGSDIKTPLIIDIGTGSNKIGFAGDEIPSMVIPTVIGWNTKLDVGTSSNTPPDPYSYSIGQDAIDQTLGAGSSIFALQYPMKIVQSRQPKVQQIDVNWDQMKYYWMAALAGSSILKTSGKTKPTHTLMNIDPREHLVLLTEPVFNPPEAREEMAEIWFELFEVPGLHIAVQAVMSLIASNVDKMLQKEKGANVGTSMFGIDSNLATGIIVDSGESCTQIIPIVQGYPVTTSINQVPLGGTQLNSFILQRLRERKESIPSEQAMRLAQLIKEKYCYVMTRAEDMPNLFMTCQPKRHVFSNEKNTTIDIGFEQFLAPEMLFKPDMAGAGFCGGKGLSELVADTVRSCPIDTRAPLLNVT